MKGHEAYHQVCEDGPRVGAASPEFEAPDNAGEGQHVSMRRTLHGCSLQPCARGVDATLNAAGHLGPQAVNTAHAYQAKVTSDF